ncbi:hypothetical protein PQQ59_37130 [Paraburkholderia aspalathi]|uniref:hypothetical protein n=1 Tax=Paraburkholderia aspalathi TaxID=1324617 RepID=UPI0038BA2EF4
MNEFLAVVANKPGTAFGCMAVIFCFSCLLISRKAEKKNVAKYLLTALIIGLPFVAAIALIAAPKGQQFVQNNNGNGGVINNNSGSGIQINNNENHK